MFFVHECIGTYKDITTYFEFKKYNLKMKISFIFKDH